MEWLELAVHSFSFFESISLGTGGNEINIKQPKGADWLGKESLQEGRP